MVLPQLIMHFAQTPVPPPTYSDLMDAVTTTISGYDVLVYAGAAAGLIFWALKRFIKAGR